MKIMTTKLVLICVLFGLLVSKFAMAVVTSQQAEEIFNLAEQAFPQYFSPALATQTFPPDWQYYRGSYNNNIYVGINADDSVYVVGGDFGNAPLNVGTNQEVLVMLQNSVNSGGSNGTICNTAAMPTGINYSQNGNVVNVTTDGCVIIPENQNLCESTSTSSSPVTGISVLTETNVLSFEFGGITSTNQAVLDSLNSLISSASIVSSSCIINAPVDYAPSTVNLDVCFDVTNNYSQFLSTPIPGVIITPPITNSIKSTQTNSVVDDCFDTGAQSITNTVTGEVWILQNGNYVMIPDI